MQVTDILGQSRNVVTRAAGTVRGTGETLAADIAGPQDATGQSTTGASTRPARPSLGSPAMSLAVLAFAAFGGLVAIRVAFKGAIS